MGDRFKKFAPEPRAEIRNNPDKTLAYLSTAELAASPAPPLPEDVERVVERLRRRATECATASASDDKDRYMNVVAKLTRQDGAIMDEALALIQSLSSQLAEAQAERDAAETVSSGWEECFEAMRIERDEAQAGVRSITEEHARIVEINKQHCKSVNSYIVSSARLEDRALAAESDRDRLAAENERLREALEPFAQEARMWDPRGGVYWPNAVPFPANSISSIKIGHLRAARALAGKAGEA